MKVIRQFCIKLVAIWQRPLRNQKKEARIDKVHANTFHLEKRLRKKIGAVDPEVIGLRLKRN